MPCATQEVYVLLSRWRQSESETRPNSLISGDITSKKKTCSLCQKAGVACHGGGPRTELRILFSELTPRAEKPAQATQQALPSPCCSPGDRGPIRGVPDTHHRSVDATDQLNTSKSPPRSLPYSDDGSSPLPRVRLRPWSRPSALHASPSVELHGHSSCPGDAERPCRWDSASVPTGDPLAQHVLESQPASATPSQEYSQTISRSNSGDTLISNDQSSQSWQLTAEQAQLVKHFLTYLLPWVRPCSAAESISQWRWKVRLANNGL
jgi:hypothetical protein